MKRALSFFAAVAVCCASTFAAAEPSEADKDAARILFTKGKELRDEGKTAAALDSFQKAWQLAPTPITTLELARTHQMLGHLVEARRLYQSIDGLEKKPGESAKSLAAREEGKQLGDALEAKIPTLIIKVNPPDGLVSASIDGHPLELATLSSPVAVDPGKHVIAVRGKTEGSATIVAVEGEKGRAITIDLPTGEVVKPPPPPPPPIVPAKPVESPWGTVRWVSGITGGVALLVGGGAGLFALSKASTVKDACTDGVCPPSHHADLDSTHRWATISTIGFGVAAVSATVFVIGVFSEPGKKKDVGVRVTPYAALDGFGLAGRF